jgi:hypothetical protein
MEEADSAAAIFSPHFSLKFPPSISAEKCSKVEAKGPERTSALLVSGV